MRWPGSGCRSAASILLAFLLPQAFPNLPVYINVARIFYTIGLNGTMLGVVLVHTMHGLVFSVWIASAAFAAIDRELEEAARNIGAGAARALSAPSRCRSPPRASWRAPSSSSSSRWTSSPAPISSACRTSSPCRSCMFNASMGGNYQIASITALILLLPSILFMLVIERFLRADVLAKVGT